MLEEAGIAARGGDPKAIIRDPAKNHRLPLPTIREGRGAPVRPADGPRPMVFHAGQPQAIVDEMTRIWAERGGA